MVFLLHSIPREEINLRSLTLEVFCLMKLATQSLTHALSFVMRSNSIKKLVKKSSSKH